MADSRNRLGTEPIGKLLFKLAAPAILAQIINALYNIVDRMYIGNIEGIGKLALTGVGLTFPVIILISAFSILVGMGGAPIAAIKMGEKNNQAAEKIMGNCLTLLLFFSVVLTAFFLIFKRPLLYMFGASDSTIGYADEYLTIYVVGTVFVQLALGMNCFITTQGFSTVGMLSVLIGAVLNIVLDPVFIFTFGMGVKGAAIATVFSQGCSAFFVLAFLLSRKSHLRFRPQNLRIDFKLIGPVLALGLSPFIMQATESLVNITLNASLQHYGGDLYVGAMTIIGSVMQVVLMPMQGLTQGAQPIISYNFGAGQFDRVKRTFRLLLTSCLIFSVTVCALILSFPQLVVRIFNSDPELVGVTCTCMRIYAAGIWAMGAQTACQQSFVAIGQAKISIFLALLRKIILLIPLALILPLFMGTSGVFIAEPIADIGAATTTTIMFAVFFKRYLTRKENELGSAAAV